jgi:hypothetical protein
MNPARKGKIARLPVAVREELNRRLEDGQTERTILPWLNALPSVQTVLAAQFGAGPVSQQNLSNWRCGGPILRLTPRQSKTRLNKVKQPKTR